jgi:hypothetical protein
MLSGLTNPPFGLKAAVSLDRLTNVIVGAG